MALENNKTITLHLNDSNRKILEPIAEEAAAKGISLSAAVIEKLTALSKPLADPVIVDTPEPVEEVESLFDADIDNTETEAETAAVESNDSHVAKIILNLTAFSDEDEYYKVKIEREDGTSETMEWVPDEVADDGDNTEENVLQLISNNNISPETQIAVEVLADDVDIEADEDEDVVVRTVTLADLGSKAVRKQLGFNEEEDEIYSDLKEILKNLKDLEQLREDYPMGQVAEVEGIRGDDDYDEDEDEDEEYEEDDEEDYDEDEDEDYDEEEDEDEDEEREYGSGGSYDDYPW